MTAPPITHHDVVQRLQQDRTWTSRDSDGDLVDQLLDALDPGHLASILAWLRQRHGVLQRDHIAALMREWHRCPTDRREIEIDVAHVQRTPSAMWLEETPLVRRLVQLAPRPTPEPRRRTSAGRRLLRTAKAWC